jgi:hypothetical protein
MRRHVSRAVWMSDVADLSCKFFLRYRQRESPVAKAVGIDKAAIRRIFYRHRDWWHAGCGHMKFMMEADIGHAVSIINEIQFLVVHRNKKLQTRTAKKWQSGAGPKLCISNGAET